MYCALFRVILEHTLCICKYVCAYTRGYACVRAGVCVLRSPETLVPVYNLHVKIKKQIEKGSLRHTSICEASRSIVFIKPHINIPIVKDMKWRKCSNILTSFKKYIRASSDLLSNKSLFGGQLERRSNHERGARVIYLLTTGRQTLIYYSTNYAQKLVYFDSNT